MASFSATVTKVGIASIAVGLAVMIIAFAVLFGFKRTIQQKIFLFGAHMQVSKFTLNLSYEEPPLFLRTNLYNIAEQIPGVRHIQAVSLKAGILKTPDELAGAVLKGVDKDYDWALFRESIIAGKVPAVAPDSGYSTEILISKRMADQLQLKVGGSVPMYFIGNQLRARKLNVVGIYETGLEEFDNTIVLGDIRLIQRLNNWGADSVGRYEVFVSDFDQLDATTRRVFDAMSPDMRLLKVTDQYRPLFDWMVLLDRNMVVFLVLIVFVSSFNMVSVLLVLMMERTPMIGLLKALGGNNKLLRQIFFYVGLNMIVWGLLIGNVVGIGLCWLQDTYQLIPLDPRNYYMSYVPIEWDWTVIVLLNIATIILIAAVLWIPTLVINRIQPVRALVFKK
ncbi:ABC transporter permease [Nibrella saemangeumensis]|uniref:ABC transporter permease n=2 Tax=Nibrella saemangeumensis TaxID=1084526 RepID=A0ABP8MKX3_9BACT